MIIRNEQQFKEADQNGHGKLFEPIHNLMRNNKTELKYH